MQAQNYFYGIMSQFDHQFCDEESRLGKSKTLYFVKKVSIILIFLKIFEYVTCILGPVCVPG